MTTSSQLLKCLFYTIMLTCQNCNHLHCNKICLLESKWGLHTNHSCDRGTVNVYDSFYNSVPKNIEHLIASLVMCTAPKLSIRNGADSGVYTIAYVYDICVGMDPCKVKYDHSLIRSHLKECLEVCRMSTFPILGERESIAVRRIQEVTVLYMSLACSKRWQVGRKWSL